MRAAMIVLCLAVAACGGKTLEAGRCDGASAPVAANPGRWQPAEAQRAAAATLAREACRG